MIYPGAGAAGNAGVRLREGVAGDRDGVADGGCEVWSAAEQSRVPQVGGSSMDGEHLKALQAPIKERYREDPQAAVVTLAAEGQLGEGVTCSVSTGRAMVEAGLHPATGGSGLQACSGNMLLEALVACAGVTLNAVATALGFPVRGAKVRAEGDLDFRGTLGVARDAQVGFRDVRLVFEVDGDLSEDQRATLLKLTERYCVVYQTLKSPPPVTAELRI